MLAELENLTSEQMEDPVYMAKLRSMLTELKDKIDTAYKKSCDEPDVAEEPIASIQQNIRHHLHLAKIRLRYVTVESLLREFSAYDSLEAGIHSFDLAMEEMETKQFIEEKEQDIHSANMLTVYHITNAPEYKKTRMLLRTYNSLHQAGFRWVKDLLKTPWSEIKSVNYLGPQARDNLLAVFTDFGLEIEEAPNSYREDMKDNVDENTRFSTIQFITKQEGYEGRVLDNRLMNVLKRNHLVYVKDVVQKTRQQLETVPYLGRETLITLETILRDFGFRIKGKDK